MYYVWFKTTNRKLIKCEYMEIGKEKSICLKDKMRHPILEIPLDLIIYRTKGLADTRVSVHNLIWAKIDESINSINDGDREIRI